MRIRLCDRAIPVFRSAVLRIREKVRVMKTCGKWCFNCYICFRSAKLFAILASFKFPSDFRIHRDFRSTYLWVRANHALKEKI
jgi:hypothetical protein